MRSPVHLTLVRLDNGDLASLTVIREPTEFSHNYAPMASRNTQAHHLRHWRRCLRRHLPSYIVCQRVISTLTRLNVLSSSIRPRLSSRFFETNAYATAVGVDELDAFILKCHLDHF